MHRDEVIMALPGHYVMRKLYVLLFRPFQLDIIDVAVARESGRLADWMTMAWWWLYDMLFSVWGAMFQVNLMWCEQCKLDLGHRQIIAAKWTQVYIVFEDEPPMFFKWVCPECGNESAVQPTGLTESAVKELGYANFKEFALENIAPATNNKGEPL